MVTGARRGELCALRWDLLDSKAGVLTIRSSIAQRGGRTWEKDTKTHQQRRITIDPQTLALLKAYRQHCAERAGMGSEMPGSARIFSLSEDGSDWLKPDTVSQPYVRPARLGHAPPPTPPLLRNRTDRRRRRRPHRRRPPRPRWRGSYHPARLQRMGGGSRPARRRHPRRSNADSPVALNTTGPLSATSPPSEHSPCQRIAADLRGAIACGALMPGDSLPTMAELAIRYGVSFGTIQRAVAQLSDAGLVVINRGRRGRLLATSQEPSTADKGLDPIPTSLIIFDVIKRPFRFQPLSDDPVN